MFNNCSALENLYVETKESVENNSGPVPGLPSKLTSIGDKAFTDCSSLNMSAQENETLVLPSTLKTLGNGVFKHCCELKHIDMSATQISKIDSITFLDCASLEELICPSKLKTIGDEAFLNCVSLKMIVFNEGLTSIGTLAFANLT